MSAGTMRGVFVTGTDTEVGKTVVATGLLRGLAQRGYRTAAMKPVASGCHATPEGLRNEDALSLIAEATQPCAYDRVNPYAFAPAIAPHLAAAEVGCDIDPNRIEENFRSLPDADICVVEGAGGWRVPLNDTYTIGAIAQRLDLAVVLVVGVRLGCINHALLTAEAVTRDGLCLAGWVANTVAPSDERVAEQIATLQHWLDAPCLGVVPALSNVEPAVVAQHLDPRFLIKALRTHRNG
jgi:dethiobiotin synthetase